MTRQRGSGQGAPRSSLSRLFWGYLIALMALSLGACAGPVGRSLTPASLTDVDQVQGIVADSFQNQRDAYIRAKAEDAADPTMAAFDAGVDASDQPPVSGSFGKLLDMLMQLLAAGALGTGGATVLSKIRRARAVLEPPEPVKPKARTRKTTRKPAVKK